MLGIGAAGAIVGIDGFSDSGAALGTAVGFNIYKKRNLVRSVFAGVVGWRVCFDW